MYQPPTLVGYDNPVRQPGEQRSGTGLGIPFWTALLAAVQWSAPRLTAITTGTPVDGQILTGSGTDATNAQVNLNAPVLPAGHEIGYEKPDDSPNTVVITMTPTGGGASTKHTLRFKGHQIVLVSRGDGTYDKRANWLPYDGLKALLDTTYATPAYVDGKVATATPSTAVVDQGTISNGAHTPSLAPAQQATFTTAAPTIATPAVSGQTPTNGQRVYGRYLASGASLLFTLGGSPARSAGYPASLQVPSGKRCRIVWEYTTLGTAGWTVLSFVVEQ